MKRGKPLALNAFQTVARDTFASGDMAHITTENDLAFCGDMLFQHVLADLADDGDDKMTLATARDRIQTAITELQDLNLALHNPANALK